MLLFFCRCFFIHLGIAVGVHPYVLQCAFRRMACARMDAAGEAENDALFSFFNAHLLRILYSCALLLSRHRRMGERYTGVCATVLWFCGCQYVVFFMAFRTVALQGLLHIWPTQQTSDLMFSTAS